MSMASDSRALLPGSSFPLGAGAPPGFGPPPGLSADGGDGLNLADITRVLKQRKLLILIAAIVLYALVGAATLITHEYFPAYTSEAIFQLEPPAGLDTFVQSANDAQLQPQMIEQLLKTEASKLRQLSVTLEVVKRDEVKASAYYRWYDSDAGKAAEGLQDDLVSAPLPESRLVRLSLATSDKRQSQTILRAVVEEYDKTFREASRTALGGKQAALKQTETQLRNALNDAVAETKSYQARTNVPAMQRDQAHTNVHIDDLKSQIALYESQAVAYDQQLDSLRGYDPNTLPLTGEQQLLVEADPELRYYRTQVESLDVQLQVLAERLGSKHRDYIAVRGQRDTYSAKETAKREELVDQVRVQERERLLQGREQIRALLTRLQEKLANEQAAEADISKNLLGMQERNDTVRRIEEQLKEVSLEMLKLNQAKPDASTASLRRIQEPSLAVRASRPNLKLWLGGGVFLALAGAVGLAFLRELTDKAVRTPLDVARHGRLSVLGTIPLLDDDQSDLDDIAKAVRVSPQSLIAESFRRVRANLQFSGPAESQRILLLTSPGPSDGKSAVAINLAATLALSGQRVLLIDCNFRRPAVRLAFAGTRVEGLSNVLIGQVRLEDALTQTETPNLHVLTSGPLPPTPADLLGSPAMRELLTRARSMYDRIILDGPPSLLMSDASVLATLVDGVILVARAEENTKGALRRAKEQLEHIGARVLGAILNGVRSRAGGYFREQYRDFYDYTSDETVPPELPGPQR